MPFSLTKHRRLVTRLLWVAGASVALTLLMPQRVRFPYRVEQGQPWTYGNLLAPFDFAIAKSPGELEAERQNIREDFMPFYARDAEVASRVLNAYRRDMKRRLPQWQIDSTVGWSAADTTRLMAAGRKAINAVYARGVLALDSAHADFGPDRSFQILDGDAISIRRRSSFVDSDQDALAALLSATRDARVQAYLKRVLPPLLLPDHRYKARTSEAALAEQLAGISPRRGKVGKGEKIIYTGEIITAERYRVLESLRAEYEGPQGGANGWAMRLGYGILVVLTLTLFSLFLLQFRADIFRHQRSLVFVLLLIIAFVALTVFIRDQGWPVLYLVPLCIVPIIIRTFFGTRAALFTHLVVVLLSALLVDRPGLFVFLHLNAGLAAIFANLKAQYWSQFFVAMAWLLVAYGLTWTGFSLVQEGSFRSLDVVPFGWLALNVFFCLMAYPLILVFERLFGVVSGITLRELADLNKPLLRELSLKAPGTMQHSVQVANLAEAAVGEIGGNPLLTRVGALYHDVGKMVLPLAFIENQQGGHNPHDEWSPEKSALTIIEHVPSGLHMARKHSLPDAVSSFIRTHHGTTRVEYFWNAWLNADPARKNAETPISDEAFRYPGPIPSTRETAVVLLADTVEAATRSLQRPTGEELDGFVDRLVQHKIDEGQLDHADLTFREITQIKKVFKKLLRSIHHVRVAYPSSDKPKDAQPMKGAEPESASSPSA